MTTQGKTQQAGPLPVNVSLKDTFVKVYDTTLRDGAQGEAVSFSVTDKIRIAEHLDSFGIDYIEGGWPGSNPKDMNFFREMCCRDLKHAKLTAFGSTRRANNSAAQDRNLHLLIEAGTPVATIFGKSWLLHVNDVLRVRPEQNLDMIESSCAFLAEHDKEVIFDAEHFFDGYLQDPDYAMNTVLRAIAGGATTVVLCDTNGGMLPSQLATICREVLPALPSEVTAGIHCHNDSDCAVANSLLAIEAGCRHVQGTINGLGERCGNANLCSIIPALALKMDIASQSCSAVRHLTNLSKFVFDLANMRRPANQPYVGSSAFAHKGGMHVNAVAKNPHTFEHICPEQVGNQQRILVSDQSGGSNILLKAQEHDIKLDAKGPEVKQILAELKELEAEGYEYESADASFRLLLQKLLKKHKPFFELEGFRVIVEKRGPNVPCLSEATIKVKVGGKTEITAAEGDGPVNALDLALRKVLLPFYPDIGRVQLRDFKVRILDGKDGTAAKTRVLIESCDDRSYWGTVGVSENIIEASWEALVDSVEYVLYGTDQLGKRVQTDAQPAETQNAP